VQPSKNGPDDRPNDSVYSLSASVRGVLGALVLLGVLGAVITAPVAGALSLADGQSQVASESATAVATDGSVSQTSPGSQVDEDSDSIRSIEYGDIVSGSIDADYPSAEEYRGYHEPITFDGSEGDILRAQMIGGDINAGYYTEPGSDTDPYLMLVAPDGDVIAENDDSEYGLNAGFSGVVLPSDGEYTIVATSYGDNQTFDYTLRLQQQNVESVDLRSIERNSTATGAIDKEDPSSQERNGFYEPVTFDGAAGEEVEITMGSQFGDTYLQLLGPDGELIAENDDNSYSLNSSLEASLPSDGEYTIVATSFSDRDTFEYELSLDVRAGGAGGADLRAIQAGQTRESELDENDPQASFMRGYFEPVSFDGESGQSVTIDMESAEGDTYLFLYGPNGDMVAQNDDYQGLNSRIETTLSDTGEYTIVATSFDDEATFSYELSVTENEVENIDLREIDYGETREGAIDSGDPESDTYRGNYEPVTFEGSAGENVTIDMTSEDDTYLILLGPDGTIVAENDDYDSLDSRVEASLPSDGTYTIVATSFSPRATFPYELTLERTE